MLNDFTKSIYNKVIVPFGEVMLYNTLPNEFELYLVCLQIVDDDKNEIIDYLVFPVNQSSVMQIQKSFTNVKKTFNAIHVNENNTWSPNPISMSGNFGRGFKFVMTGKQTIPLKTGYGVVKYLSNLIKLSKENNSNGRPYRTILYNLAFGDIVTVEIIDCKFTQTQQEARIWNYDLSMIAVAPGDIGSGSLNFGFKNFLAFTIVNKIMNQAVKLI